MGWYELMVNIESILSESVSESPWAPIGISMGIFALSFISKSLLRADKLREKMTQPLAFYDVAKQGTELCLAALSIMLSLALSKGSRPYGLPNIWVITAILGIVFLVVSFVEYWFRFDPVESDRGRAQMSRRHILGGLAVPDLLGLSLVWFASAIVLKTGG